MTVTQHTGLTANAVPVATLLAQAPPAPAGRRRRPAVVPGRTVRVADLVRRESTAPMPAPSSAGRGADGTLWVSRIVLAAAVTAGAWTATAGAAPLDLTGDVDAHPQAAEPTPPVAQPPQAPVAAPATAPVVSAPSTPASAAPAAAGVRTGAAHSAPRPLAAAHRSVPAPPAVGQFPPLPQRPAPTAAHQPTTARQYPAQASHTSSPHDGGGQDGGRHHAKSHR